MASVFSRLRFSVNRFALRHPEFVGVGSVVFSYSSIIVYYEIKLKKERELYDEEPYVSKNSMYALGLRKSDVRRAQVKERIILARQANALLERYNVLLDECTDLEKKNAILRKEVEAGLSGGKA